MLYALHYTRSKARAMMIFYFTFDKYTIHTSVLATTLATTVEKIVNTYVKNKYWIISLECSHLLQYK
jgi:hypothetical protein